MKYFIRFLLVAIFWIPDSGHAQLRFQPAVLYDVGGKFDKSLNEGVAAGIRQLAEKSGVQVREFEITTETQREQALRNMARRGDDPILAVGAAQAPAVRVVAAEFPETRFAIVDAVVNLPNVQSIVFRDYEAAFLVGALAATSSRSGKIGFIGAVAVPRVQRVACGFIQGARYAKPEIAIQQNMVGSAQAAWNDPIKGAELARSQFDAGADIVLHAAGGSGLGVLQAAVDAGKLAIGNDFNQNGLHPGHVLTSLLRRVDAVTFNMYKTAAQGTWRPGVLSLGLKERGTAWALDEHNAGLVSEPHRKFMEQLQSAIIGGQIEVADYTTTGKCPVQP